MYGIYLQTNEELIGETIYAWSHSQQEALDSAEKLEQEIRDTMKANAVRVPVFKLIVKEL
jgi:hypothetical protein